MSTTPTAVAPTAPVSTLPVLASPEPGSSTKNHAPEGPQHSAAGTQQADGTVQGDSEGELKIERFRLKVFKFESIDLLKADDKQADPSQVTDQQQPNGENGQESDNRDGGQDDKNDGKEGDRKGDQKSGKKGGDPPTPALPIRKPVTIIEYMKTSKAFQETTLRDLRTKIISVMNEAFRFCDTTGAILQDETTLSSYLGELGVPTPRLDIPMDIYIVPFTRQKISAAELLDRPPFVLKFVQKLEDDELQKEGTLHSSLLSKVEGGKVKLKELRKYVQAMSASSSRHQFCLDDGHAVDDEVTLKEYVASLSKVVEEDETSQATSAIEIYFSKPGVTRKSKFNGATAEVKAAMQKPGLTLKGAAELSATRDKAVKPMSETLQEGSFKLQGTVGDTKAASGLTEDEWAIVIRNCNMMFGWIVDAHNNKVVRAPKAAFQLRKGLNMGVLPVLDEPNDPQITTGTIAIPPTTDMSTASTANDGSATPMEDMPFGPKITAPEKARGIPHFAVDDDSRIEITMTSHEFQESMAKAHFSATSVEAEISGGHGAVSGGVSGGYSRESSESEKSSSQRNEKTLIGTYRFPRATVYLTPNDLEPTPELKAAIKRIRTRKNILDLRQLHKDFGHLFCRKVAVGGCLQTTRTITMTTEMSEKSEKSQFKATLGAAIQTPRASASVKASHEQGDASEMGKIKTDINEKLVFEATGGNTILASDPMSWTISVADSKNWRVIEQDALSSLADAISEMPGYGDAITWFMQAVPSLSRYVQIPRSRTLNIRFKAVLNEHVRDILLGTDGPKYLGHNDVDVVEFVHNQITVRPEAQASYLGPPRIEKEKLILDMTTFTNLAGRTAADPLFTPRSAQSPALLLYKGILGLEGAKRIPKVLIDEVEAAKAKVRQAETAKAEAAKLEATTLDVASVAGFTLGGLWGKILQMESMQNKARELEVAKQQLAKAEEQVEKAKNSNELAIKKFSREFKTTVWRLEVPDGGVLVHDARVNVRSLAVEPNPTLSVYRNYQGVYLPTMTSHNGPCFWRILKRDPASQKGDPIRDGDDIRLCWRFSDQADGFRDFMEDTFGRRRYTKPDDAGDVLYLKVPYPPIQSSPTDVALVLSSADTRKPIVEKFKTLPEGSESYFNLHDLAFRIDAAGENGLGESMDYMAPIVDFKPRSTEVLWGEAKSQFSVPAMFVGSMLLSGISGPIASSLLSAILL